MPLKLADATISTFDCVFDKFKVEALNNKINFILFLADNDPSTSWCPDCVRSELVIYKRLEAIPDDVALLRKSNSSGVILFRALIVFHTRSSSDRATF
ncbi:hypothetical protein PS1_000674 [Malus domestica]